MENQWNLNLYSFNFLPEDYEITFNDNIGKIVLPNSILDNIYKNEDNDKPLIFKLTSDSGKEIFAGLLDGTFEENCYSPYRYLQDLFVSEGSNVTIELIELEPGKKIIVQPETSDFLDLPNHKEILEKNLSENYVALSEGTSFTITNNNKNYDLNVISTYPINGISLFNTDIEIDFLQPIDYKLSDKNALDMITNLINSQKIPLPEKLLDIIKETGRQVNKYNTHLTMPLPQKEPDNTNFVAFSGKGHHL